MVALVLEGYAAQPGAAAFQRLLELFTREAVTQTLGFTLQHQAGQEARETAEGLLLVVAHLVKVPLLPGFKAAEVEGVAVVQLLYSREGGSVVLKGFTGW